MPGMPSMQASDAMKADSTAGPPAPEANGDAQPASPAATPARMPQLPARMAKSGTALKAATQQPSSPGASTQPPPGAANGSAAPPLNGAPHHQPNGSGSDAASGGSAHAAPAAGPSGRLGAAGPQLPGRRPRAANGPSSTHASAAAAHQPTAASAAPAGASTASPSSARGGTAGSVTVRPGSGGGGGGGGAALPALPKRGSSSEGGSAAAAAASVVDPDDPPATQRVRQQVHAIRVCLIRAAKRLGYDADHGIVKQVLYRLFLAEKLKEPWRKAPGKRLDPSLLASREAEQQEAAQGPHSPLGLEVTILLIGLSGTGKTQLAAALLADDPEAALPSAPGGDPAPTRGVEVHSGTVAGIRLRLVDTPGLTACAADSGGNVRPLRAVRAAFRRHKPDLVIYVDRFDQATRNGGEMAALQSLTAALGPGVWLNTVIALTHAGAGAPASARGPMAWDAYAQQRSHLLQLIVRNASGDARLMNPIACVESHPACPRDEQGHRMLPTGLPWVQHLLLMVVSAKLLADAEVALQMQSGAGAGAGAAQSAADPVAQMLRPTVPPVRYLMTQLTQFSSPVLYPGQASVMDVRSLQATVKRERDPHRAKDLHRQARLRLLQMGQMMRRQERLQDMQQRATKAGAKVTPEPPRIATRARPAMHREATWRYRVPEAQAGWIVRPHLEPHGMDGSDCVEGFLAQKAGCWRPAAADLTRGVPYRCSGSAQTSKSQTLLQARVEGSAYHTTGGRATTTVSVDAQTSGARGAADMLVVARADAQLAGVPWAGVAPSAGVMVTRLAEGCRPDRGPLALGWRLQNCMRLGSGGGWPLPLEVDASAAGVTCRDVAEGSPGSEDALGANLELRADARRLLGASSSLPLAASCSVMRHGGETVAAAALSAQVRAGRRGSCAAKVQVNNRSVAQASLKVRSETHVWGALVGLVPLVTAAAEWLEGWRGQRRRQQQAQHSAAAAAAAAQARA